jgi:hypothetical protein
MPALDDFNEDLRRLGAEAMRDGLRAQLAPGDATRFMQQTSPRTW